MKYINHYDEGLNKSFEIPEYSMEEVVTLQDFIDENPQLFHAALMSAVHNGVMLDLDHVPVFCVAETQNVFEIVSYDYLEKIDICLTYFTSIEEYEFCSTLADLKSKIESDESS